MTNCQTLVKGGHMSRSWKIAILILVALLFGVITLGWSAPQTTEPRPVFTDKDHKLIDEYYLRLAGSLAPGSIDRSDFSRSIEQSLATGSHVPMQLEKDLKPLPSKLESQLSQLTGEYGRYTLGQHIVLVRKNDMSIADIIKNVAVK
jgi:hypothetical protein